MRGHQFPSQIVGTVLNAIGPCAGRGLVVFGAGGVGLSVVMGAVLAGAYPIVAIDMVTDRLDAATRLGATHVVRAGSEDVAADQPSLQGRSPMKGPVPATDAVGLEHRNLLRGDSAYCENPHAAP